MVAMLERVSMLCARVMRGMASRLKLVMRRRASICTNSGLRNGARNPISALPSGNGLASSSADTGRTRSRQSAIARQLAGIRHDSRPRGLEFGVGNGGGQARAALDQHGMLVFEQEFDGVRHRSHPGFGFFFKNGKLH